MNYYLLNTNRKLDPSGIDEKTMLDEKIAAAYFGRWKAEISKLEPGDVVFLYRTGEGVIAFGRVTGDLKIRNYRNIKKFKNEEYYKQLNDFEVLNKPISAKEINHFTEHKVSFQRTLIKLNESIAKVIIASHGEDTILYKAA